VATSLLCLARRLVSQVEGTFYRSWQCKREGSARLVVGQIRFVRHVAKASVLALSSKAYEYQAYRSQWDVAMPTLERIASLLAILSG
jgi:hypothetical protein